MSDSTVGTDGLLRYRVWILVERADGDDSISFNAYGPVLPRIGERLEINGVIGEDLSILVTAIDHDWFLSGEDTDSLPVTVVGEIMNHHGQKLANRLVNEPGALKAWLSRFPLLEPVEDALEP
ncbi:hypothetical protein [Nocardia sp. NPDC046763]|uniref:hypothetical protein n=1 Tax=Nocardia sp. NPDC046763 TaxID=3155256 RepID=UPI0033FF4566